MKSSSSLTMAIVLVSMALVRSAPIEDSIHVRSLLGGDTSGILNLSGSQGNGKNVLGNGILSMENEAESIQEKGSERTPLTGKGDKPDILGSIQQLLNQPKGNPGKALLKRAINKGLLSPEEINHLLKLTKAQQNPDMPSSRILSTKENENLISRLLSTPLSGASKGANPLSSLLSLGSDESGDNHRPGSTKALNGLNLLKRALPLDILSGLTGGKATPGKSILSAPTINSDDEKSQDQEQITRILDDKKEKETAIIQSAPKSGASKEGGLLRILNISKDNANSEPAMSRLLAPNTPEEKQNNLGLGKLDILKLGKREQLME